MDKNPKIFISYTQDGEEHSNKILDLANKLRSEGIDVTLDQYEQSPPEGWPQWMDRGIKNADFVLMVCTENYYKRVMGEEKTGVGQGLKWEGRLIYQHLYNSDSQSQKFIPIVFRDEEISYIPIPIQGGTHYNTTNPNQYDKLYWLLRGISPVKKPDLGKLRPLPKKERKSLFVGGFIDVDLWNKGKWCGIAVSQDYELKEPPSLCFLFDDETVAREIMQKWLLRLGDTDNYNELRISIIEGDILGKEPGYSIHINANVENIIKRSDVEGLNIPQEMFMIFGRIHRMYPAPDSKNLEIFKASYKRFGSYFLKVGTFYGKAIKILDDIHLHKRDIEFRNVEDIQSKDDLDYVVLPESVDKSE